MGITQVGILGFSNGERRDGTAGFLAGHMEHHDRRGLEQYIAKHNHYAVLEAYEIVHQNNKVNEEIRPSLFGGSLNRRRWIKRYIYPWLPARWFFRFLWMYFLQLGFLDGKTGFRFCLFISSQELLITLNIIELLQKESADGD